jgi:hypothetical protein
MENPQEKHGNLRKGTETLSKTRKNLSLDIYILSPTRDLQQNFQRSFSVECVMGLVSII